MGTPERLPDEALDGLLDGSPSPEAVGTPLAAYLAAIREDALSTEPTPSASLAEILAEGLDPVGLQGAVGSSGRSAEGVLTRGILTLRRRAGLLASVTVAKFTAFGMVAKAAAAGAAVTVAASGAGAAGILPAPAQTTFDEVVGREAPAEEAEDEAPTTAVPDTTGPGPTWGGDVSDDATGDSDGVAGVEGGEVAGDASHARDGVPDEPRQDTPAGDRTNGTPAEDEVDDPPARDRSGPDAPAGDGPAKDAPTDAPPTAPRGPDPDQRDTAEQSDAEEGDAGQANTRAEADPASEQAASEEASGTEQASDMPTSEPDGRSSRS